MGRAMRYVPWTIIVSLFLLPLLIWVGEQGIGGSTASLGADVIVGSLYNVHYLAAKVAVATVWVTIPAVLLCRSVGRRGAAIVAGALMAPAWVGMLARNYGWIGMLSGTGFASSLGWHLVGGSSLLYTSGAVQLVMTFVFIPWAFFLMTHSLRSIRSIHIEAAQVMGAGEWQIARRVFGKRLIDGSALAFFLVYCSTLGYFITPKLIGGGWSDLPGSILMKLIDQGDFPSASTLALCLLASSVPFVIGVLIIASRQAEGPWQ